VVVQIETSKRIVKNATSLFLGDVGVRLVTALATIILARYLGAEDFGAISLGIAFASVVGYFTDAGLTHTMIREATRPTADLPELLSSGFKLRLLFAAATTVVSTVIISIVYPEPHLQRVVLLVVAPTIWGGALQASGNVYFQIIQEMQYIALTRLVAGTLSATALIAGILLQLPLIFLAFVYGLAALIAGLVSVALMLRKSPLVGGWNTQLFTGLGSFTLSGLITMGLPQLGPIVLERVAELASVGYFAAAYRIPSLLYRVPGSIAGAFYPQLFYYGSHNLFEHFKLCIRELKLMTFIGIACALPFSLYSHVITRALFGPEWSEPTGNALQLLAWVVLFQSINYPLADALTTQHMQPRRTLTLGIGLATGTVAYAVLGSWTGVIGASIAAIVTELALLIGFVVSNPRGGQLFLQGLAKPMLALLLILMIVIPMKLLLDTPWLGFFLTPLWSVLVFYFIDPDIRNSAKGLSQALLTTRVPAS
jgi:O-antigen/teichoic acid export membrane protein